MLTFDFDRDVVDLGMHISFDRDIIALEPEGNTGYFSNESFLTYTPYD